MANGRWTKADGRQQTLVYDREKDERHVDDDDDNDDDDQDDDQDDDDELIMVMDTILRKSRSLIQQIGHGLWTPLGEDDG